MKRFASALLVASSFWFAIAAPAATRPKYGGTLHVAVQAAPLTLDPADSSQPASPAYQNILRMIYDTLVVLDDRGLPQPGLAVSWQPLPGNQRWQLELRHGVTFSDGTPVTPEVVAASLRFVRPAWKVSASGGQILVELNSPDASFPAALALAQLAVIRRDGAKLLGTGPFAVASFDPGKKLVLAAREDYWNGRAYLDSLEIDLGRSLHDQAMSMDLGREQLIELAVEQIRRPPASTGVIPSAPVILMALVFPAGRLAVIDPGLRDALSLSIDRATLNSAFLQGAGQPAGSLLPNWMTGYSFLFPANFSPALSREAVAGAKQQQTSWSLGYDAGDPLSRQLAERIVLNARDTGISLKLTTGGLPDVRLVRMPVTSIDPHVALTQLAMAAGLAPPQFAESDSIENLYAAERELLQSRQVIPLLHLPLVSALKPEVNGWTESPGGSWPLADLWLAGEKP